MFNWEGIRKSCWSSNPSLPPAWHRRMALPRSWGAPRTGGAAWGFVHPLPPFLFSSWMPSGCAASRIKQDLQHPLNPPPFLCSQSLQALICSGDQGQHPRESFPIPQTVSGSFSLADSSFLLSIFLQLSQGLCPAFHNHKEIPYNEVTSLSL